MPAHERPHDVDPLTLLREGEIELKGRMPWSSNGTFLVGVRRGEITIDAVYKPVRGERPLWDFPDGLWRREVAAYELSSFLGWGVVPETVARTDDAPLGEGSLQRFVPADFSQHYFTLLDDERHHDALRTIAVFDLVANNTDRKGGHCLLGTDGRIWAIDNGLCFHPQPKLRTVIWDFAGEPVPAPLVADLERALATGLPPALSGLLHDVEERALRDRMRRVVELPELPSPDDERGHPYPWPLV